MAGCLATPADKTPLPRAAKPEKRFLTHGEVANLADAAGDYGLAIRVLAYTGLRFGELAALRVRRLDLMRRRIEMAESVTEVGGRAVYGHAEESRRAVRPRRPVSGGRTRPGNGRQGSR
jgi:integrase